MDSLRTVVKTITLVSRTTTKPSEETTPSVGVAAGSDALTSGIVMMITVMRRSHQIIALTQPRPKSALMKATTTISIGLIAKSVKT